MEELKFDSKINEYYITPEAVLNNRAVSEDDLFNSLKDPAVMLKDFSRTIYRYIYKYYQGEDRARHKEEIRYILETDAEAREGLKQAIIEYTMGALVSELDLNKYLAEVGPHLAPSAHDELWNANLLRRRTRSNTEVEL